MVVLHFTTIMKFLYICVSSGMSESGSGPTIRAGWLNTVAAASLLPRSKLLNLVDDIWLFFQNDDATQQRLDMMIERSGTVTATIDLRKKLTRKRSRSVSPAKSRKKSVHLYEGKQEGHHTPFLLIKIFPGNFPI